MKSSFIFIDKFGEQHRLSAEHRNIEGKKLAQFSLIQRVEKTAESFRLISESKNNLRSLNVSRERHINV